MTSADHQADDSYLGYVYQGLYALVLLLDAQDEESVSVETADDVLLEGREPCLHQLKHSVKVPKALSVKNDGLWKTIGVWAVGLSTATVRRFVFVTCAPVAKGDALDALVTPGAADGRNEAVRALKAEAARVVKAVEDARANGKALPYKTRLPGCSAFLALTPDQQRQFVERLTIKPDSFTARDIDGEVDKRLRHCLLPAIRGQVARRLIEWWDRQVTLALLKDRSTAITKAELQQRLHQLIAEHGEHGLPDDFGDKEPPDHSLELGGPMQAQIELVRGGQRRLHRAARVRWQARKQRERWMHDDIVSAAFLQKFNDRLTKAWRDRHGPMCDDFRGECEDKLCEEGLKLLDWSHHNAPQEIAPPRRDWTNPYLVQGSYQQMAEELQVGWHPEYAKRLGAHPVEEEDTG